MKKENNSDEELEKRLQGDEKESTDFLRGSTTRQELNDIISYLIAHRESLKAVELARLETESERLLKALRRIDAQKLIEEIHCFKEILTLHKVLIEENGPTGY